MSRNRRQFLRLCVAGTGAALAGCSAPIRSSIPGGDDAPEKIDDWQYTPEERDYTGIDHDAAETDESIGLAPGGAADVGTFRRNVAEGYLPIPESMAYEGLFHEYYFDTGGDGSCASLFCPTYTPAVTPDPLSGEPERYVSVGLDSGLSQSDFERPPLNLVIVLDTSGSMRSSFDDYYYDQYGNEQKAEGGTSHPKMDVAKDALVSMTHHLRPEDRFGVVLFDSDAYLAKPLRAVEATDMDAIREHIREDIRAAGGTNISAPMKMSEGLMEDYEGSDATDYENRSILLTDAQINLGETDGDELRGTLEENAERGHHTTVVGIGVDFNTDLIDQITAVRGANYYSVYSEDEFERRMDDEFEYMVTPLVYDLSLELDADGYEITQVYGSPDADGTNPAGGTSEEADDDQSETTTGLMHVKTLFPSPRTDGEARGGVVLVQVQRTGEGEQATSLDLEANWETRSGEEQSTVETVTFSEGDGEWFGNTAVRKATLLARYADLLKNWTVYEREETLVGDGEGIDAPPEEDQLGKWELQSDPLTVSSRYESRIRTFREHFQEEASAIGDDSLDQELELMSTLLNST